VGTPKRGIVCGYRRAPPCAERWFALWSVQLLGGSRSAAGGPGGVPAPDAKGRRRAGVPGPAWRSGQGAGAPRAPLHTAMAGRRRGSARHNLSNALTVLRQALEPPGVAPGSVLEADRQGVRLCPRSFTCDAADFERGATTALVLPPGAEDQGRALAAACAVYAGSLLAGLSEFCRERRLRTPPAGAAFLPATGPDGALTRGRGAAEPGSHHRAVPRSGPRRRVRRSERGRA